MDFDVRLASYVSFIRLTVYDRMSIQSALIGFLISRMLPVPLTPQEIIVVQTTAVATGTMPLAAGFVGILPALTLISEERDGTPPIHLSWLSAVAWSCGIIEEQLTFPSGTATAQLISVLHKLPPPDTSVRQRFGYTQVSSEDGVRREDPHISSTADPDEVDAEWESEERMVVEHDGWRTLSWSFGASSTLTAIICILLPSHIHYSSIRKSPCQRVVVVLYPESLLCRPRHYHGIPDYLKYESCWAILSPLSKFSGWAPGPVGDMTDGARGWILWTALGIMCADSFVSLLPVLIDYVVDSFSQRGQDSEVYQYETETEERLVPSPWVLGGLLTSIFVGTFLVWAVFGHDGIKPWATVLGFILGGMLSIFGVRALGETDLNPVSGLGKISQLVFAWVQPGNIVANIIAGGVTEAGAQQAGDLMQDLKTGHLLHASPRSQFYGQFIGSTVSILVTTTAFTLYNRAYVIPGPSFPAPTAYVWLSLARLLHHHGTQATLDLPVDSFWCGFCHRVPEYAFFFHSTSNRRVFRISIQDTHHQGQE
ncbi:hypothetical protein C0989_012293 [Termitomyces sp. Mn162]|nr:hypothetical protein C0989_012293 [Termitomyces sp. Mn162]